MPLEAPTLESGAWNRAMFALPFAPSAPIA
jgi:hypothetical protein